MAFVACVGQVLFVLDLTGSATAAHTHGYAYGTESGATRRPRVPVPKGTRTYHWILEAFKRK